MEAITIGQRIRIEERLLQEMDELDIELDKLKNYDRGSPTQVFDYAILLVEKSGLSRAIKLLLEL